MDSDLGVKLSVDLNVKLLEAAGVHFKLYCLKLNPTAMEKQENYVNIHSFVPHYAATIW